MPQLPADSVGRRIHPARIASFTALVDGDRLEAPVGLSPQEIPMTKWFAWGSNSPDGPTADRQWVLPAVVSTAATRKQPMEC